MRLHWLAVGVLTLLGCGLPHGPLSVEPDRQTARTAF